MVDLARTIPLLEWNPYPPDVKDPDIVPRPTPTPSPTPTFTPTSTPTPIPTPGFHIVTGTVTDAALKRLAGVRIELSTSEPRVYTALTDANGFFRINDVWTPAEYTLRASLPGQVFDSISGYLTGDTNAAVRARASRQYQIRVKVMTGSMSPIGGVLLDGGSLGSAATNSAGIAVFSGTYGSTYTIIPSHPMYTFADGSRTGTVYGEVTRVIAGELTAP